MRNDSNNRLIAALEPVRDLLRYVESMVPELREPVLEVRLSVDQEIENLKHNMN
jgi:hypothetical protein